MELVVSAVAVAAVLILVARQVPGRNLPIIVAATSGMILIVIAIETMMRGSTP